MYLQYLIDFKKNLNMLGRLSTFYSLVVREYVFILKQKIALNAKLVPQS
jgi:hypothetical protein